MIHSKIAVDGRVRWSKLRTPVALLRLVAVAAAGLWAAMLWPAAARAAEPVALGQGLMAAEVTENSVVLQARLTRGTELVDGDLPGAAGQGVFVLTDVAPEGKQIRPDGDGVRTSTRSTATAENDFVLRARFDGLKRGTRYHYQLAYGRAGEEQNTSPPCTFRTLGGAGSEAEYRLAVVTGMNYAFFHDGHKGGRDSGVPKEQRRIGYPGLKAMADLRPDCFIGTGDNVYYDHPGGDKSAVDEKQMRRKWHEQFSQRRFIELFARTAAYWEKDDHDFRYNDCDLTGVKPPSVELGLRIFKEQVPLPDPPYRTLRVNRHLQVWLLEGRDFRSPNAMPDGPDKTIWGRQQREWFQRTLAASDAAYRVIVSPTPLVGPDSVGKRDNHVNPRGFRHERDAFFAWLKDKGLTSKPQPGRPQVLLVCGDRHWQYHAVDPSGMEEFSCGALVDENAVAGSFPGQPKSSDPQGTIRHLYHPRQAQGGFLMMTVQANGKLVMEFYDTAGRKQYDSVR